MPATRVPQESTLPNAIEPNDQVKMIVIGGTKRAKQIAGIADVAALRAVQPSGFTARKVIWVIDPVAAANDLNAIVPQPFPTIVVLNRDNTINDQLSETDDPN